MRNWGFNFYGKRGAFDKMEHLLQSKSSKFHGRKSYLLLGWGWYRGQGTGRTAWPCGWKPSWTALSLLSSRASHSTLRVGSHQPEQQTFKIVSVISGLISEPDVACEDPACQVPRKQERPNASFRWQSLPSSSSPRSSSCCTSRRSYELSQNPCSPHSHPCRCHLPPFPTEDQGC